MSVDAVVVTHGDRPELAECRESLASQVDEIVVVANTPDLLPELPKNGRLIRNAKRRGFAANANEGFAMTGAPFIVLANPDTVAEPDAVRLLHAFAEAHPRAGVVGPQLRWPDGRWQPSRRRFPTVRGTIVRRTPLRRLLHPYHRQRAHYLLDGAPSEPV